MGSSKRVTLASSTTKPCEVCQSTSSMLALYDGEVVVKCPKHLVSSLCADSLKWRVSISADDAETVRIWTLAVTVSFVLKPLRTLMRFWDVDEARWRVVPIGHIMYLEDVTETKNAKFR